MSDIVIYEDGTLALSVTVEKESVWLNRNQMAKLFDRDVKTIGKHLANIFREKELDKNSTIAKFETVQKEGNREIRRNIEYYSLDVIISVGYRVKSKIGTQFRIWANRVLKDYIIKGYALSQKRLQVQKLQELEDTINVIKQSMSQKELSANEAKGFVEIVRYYKRA